MLDLKVRNILGLREAFIVFEPGAVAIVGPNGAGKSSILDSLVLALFGSTTPVRNVNNQSIIRTGTSEGYVICTFVKDGNKYRVTRKFRAPKGQQEALLERHVDGRWQPFASTVREVNEGIVKVLSPFIGNPTDTTLSGLREAFISTVFVPQGMVTKFVDVSPGDRWQILVASLGLEGESTLQERVRRVIEDASREVENIKGHLSKISDFLEKMPPLEEINRNLVSLNNQLRGLQDELTLNEKAIETAKRLQDLQARASRYKAEIEQAKDNFERLYENLRLYDAKQALKRLVAASVNYGDLRKKIRLVENGINAIDKRVNPKLNEIELLRNNYKNLLNEIKKLNNIAKYRDLAYKYIDLHRNITKCEQDIKLLNKEIHKNKQAYDQITSRRQGLVCQKLRRNLVEIIDEHKRASHSMAVARERIRSKLIDWITELAPNGVVDFSRFRGNRAIEVAKGLLSSDLGQALSEWANAQNKALFLLKEGRRLRDEISHMCGGMTYPEASLDDIEAALDDVDKQMKVLEIKGQKLVGVLEKNLSDLQTMTATLLKLEPELGDLDPQYVVKACEKREDLLKEMEILRSKGDGLNVEINRLNEKRHTMEVELAELQWRRDVVLKELKEATSQFKAVCAKYQLSHEDKWQLVHSGDVRPCKQEEVEREKNRIEWLQGLLANIEKELSELEPRIRDGLPDLDKLLSLREEINRKIEARKDEITKLKYDLQQRRSLEGEMRSIKQQFERLNQAYDIALKLQKYSDGRNFVRFLSDTILSGLLDAVNEALSFRGLSLVSENGRLYAIVNGFKRDVTTLSGGERAMVALLMLRHLANKVGFKEVLFIDEGLAMLDDENLEMMMNLFDNLGKEAFVGVITHDPDFAALFPKRIEVNGGKLKIIGN